MKNEVTFFVLNFLILRPAPVNLFFLDPNDFVYQTNYSLPDGSASSRASTIGKLLKRGLIKSSDNTVDSYLQNQTNGSFVERIETAVAENNLLELNLTPEGGKFWEQYAKPCWQRFFLLEKTKTQNDVVWKIISPSKERLVTIAKALLGLDCKRLLREEDISVTDFNHWCGLYWKNFDKAFYIEFSVNSQTTEFEQIRHPDDAFDPIGFQDVFFDVLSWANNFDGEPSLLPNQ